jgi:hypothetical protein
VDVTATAASRARARRVDEVFRVRSAWRTAAMLGR